MEDKSNIEVLKEFARKTNRDVVYKEVPVQLSGFRRFMKFKRFVFVPNNNVDRNIFFVWYSNPYARVGSYTIFSGAFVPISSRVKSSLSIRSKNVLDKVNVFSKSRYNIVGSDSFDSKVVIKGSVDSATKKFLSQAKIQNQILKALDIASFINISINEHNMDFVPELKGKSHLSIINPQSWEFERDSIEEILRRMEKIRNIIN